MRRASILRAESGVVLFIALFSILGLRTVGAASPKLEQAALSGDEIFRREGCLFCHSHPQVESDPVSVSRGSAMLTRLGNAWRRNGPDLALEPGKRTADWHLAHLLDPTAVLPACPMPSYRDLSDADLNRLIEFIQEPVTSAAQPDPTATGMAATELLPTEGPLSREAFLTGKAIYGAYCAGCHGSEGNGAGRVGHLLSPEPRDFTDQLWMNKRSDQALLTVIGRGIAGTAMSGYDQVLSPADQVLTLRYLRLFADPSLRMRYELDLLEQLGSSR